MEQEQRFRVPGPIRQHHQKDFSAALIYSHSFPAISAHAHDVLDRPCVFRESY